MLVTTTETSFDASTEDALDAALDAATEHVEEIRAIVAAMLLGLPLDERRAVKLLFMNRLGNALWR